MAGVRHTRRRSYKEHSGVICHHDQNEAVYLLDCRRAASLDADHRCDPT